MLSAPSTENAVRPYVEAGVPALVAMGPCKSCCCSLAAAARAARGVTSWSSGPTVETDLPYRRVARRRSASSATAAVISASPARCCPSITSMLAVAPLAKGDVVGLLCGGTGVPAPERANSPAGLQHLRSDDALKRGLRCGGRGNRQEEQQQVLTHRRLLPRCRARGASLRAVSAPPRKAPESR